VLERLIDAAAPQVADARSISLDMAGVQALDTIDAWLLELTEKPWKPAHPMH
jgi:hypothetical protein